jgi:hypothetical protein
MTMKSMFQSLGMLSPWAVELGFAVLGLLAGLALMPILIFYAGVSTLGRYEGASLGGVYHVVLSGLGQPSIASWVVVLGPYGLYLLLRGLRAWWRLSANLA